MPNPESNWSGGLLSGVSGAVVMTLLLMVARSTGTTDLSLSMIHGSMITRELGFATWVTGFAMHAVSGGFLGMAYAWVFQAWGRAGLARGTAVALPHLLLGGLALWLLPAIHPEVPDHPEVSAPGFLGASYGGWTVAVLIFAHLVFGAVVGGSYRVAGRRSVLPPRGSSG